MCAIKAPSFFKTGKLCTGYKRKKTIKIGGAHIDRAESKLTNINFKFFNRDHNVRPTKIKLLWVRVKLF
jgi:hypothetical protein